MPKSKKNDEDFIHLGFLSRQISLMLYDELSEIYADFGLDSRCAGILFMGLEDSFSQTHIANLARTDKNTIGVMIDLLQEKGLLERRQNPNNRKENLIVLTKSGQQIALSLQKKIAKKQKEILAFMTDERYSAFCKDLLEVYSVLKIKQTH